MLRLAICDDEPNIIEQLERYIERLEEQFIEYEVFFSAEEMWNYDHEIKYDAYILDIEMKEMSGIQLAHKIRKFNRNAEIIFITSHSEFVFESFEIVTFDYMLKPIDFMRFEKVIRNLSDYILKSKKTLSFSYNKKKDKLFCRDVVYIDKMKRKALIYTIDKQCYECNMSIADIWKQLDSRLFVSIRQGCIVNLNMITEIVGNELKLQNGQILYIGRDYKATVKRQHLDYLERLL